ncbi:MAG: hypothetical protein OEV40_01485 [Acidimicrobiia bacterium]|nr:hypothetical protein [Acidimicrobiia bacterium]
MTDLLERRVLEIVQAALRSNSDDAYLVIGTDDSMDTVAVWDSLRFMNVFVAINEAFGLDPDFDDAIHYAAVPSLVHYLREQTS